MRIRRIRTSRTRELGEIDLPLGAGLSGWSGGTARDRRLFADLLGWILGLPGGDAGPLSPEGGVTGPGSGRGAGDGFPEGPPETGFSTPIPPPISWSARTWKPSGGPEGAEAEVRIGEEVIRLHAGLERPSGAHSGEASPASLHERLGIRPDTLALAWGGGGWVEPEPLWRVGARILASRRGLDSLGRAVERLGGAGDPGDVGDEAEGDVGAELAVVTARLAELADVPHRLRELEDELRTLRADAAEVVGDLEVATMDWLRERQDAETHLQQYRDRARELRARIEEMEEMGPEGACPFCGRPLGDHFDQVLEELQEEWEDLVQDGSWWRRRRDQLELKPDVLQELEGRSVRLQAEVEECAEELERCRFELREWDELRDRREELLERTHGRGPRSELPLEGREGAAGRRRGSLLRAFGAAREELLGEERARLAREAGSLLNRMSGGRILALIDRGNGALGMVEDGRVVRGSTVEDRAAATLALHLGLAVLLRDTGVPLDSVLVGETFRGMDPEARVRSVEVLRGLLKRIPQILLLSAGEVVDGTPEAFDQILEFRPDRDRPSLKTLPGGVGRIRIGSGS